jgi:hypothetical protein
MGIVAEQMSNCLFQTSHAVKADPAGRMAQQAQDIVSDSGTFVMKCSPRGHAVISTVRNAKQSDFFLCTNTSTHDTHKCLSGTLPQ